ncbi:MAG TPA: hypothetical protein VGG45_03915 [Terracidiphilus sp.]|jgi:hypothetical protein
MRIGLALSTVFCFAAGAATIPAFAAGVQPKSGDTAHSESAAAEQCGTVFGAKVCTSYRLEAGKVTQFSLRVPIALLDQAPATAPMVWPPKADAAIPFADAVKDQTGFTFSNIYWNPMGHVPEAYMVPHYDFHFYFVPPETVAGIDCKDTNKPNAIPAGYAMPDENIPPIGELTGICIPEMGMHAIPAGDLTTKTWAGSMLVGYYSGKPVFIEPMITKALLMKKQSFSLEIPEIAATPNVRYPKKFNAVYSPESASYDFTFSY